MGVCLRGLTAGIRKLEARCLIKAIVLSDFGAIIGYHSATRPPADYYLLGNAYFCYCFPVPLVGTHPAAPRISSV